MQPLQHEYFLLLITTILIIIIIVSLTTSMTYRYRIITVISITIIMIVSLHQTMTIFASIHNQQQQQIAENFTTLDVSAIDDNDESPQFGRLQEGGIITGFTVSNNNEEIGDDFLTADRVGQTTAPDIDPIPVQITTPR
jgi:hypothetical protein